MNDLDLRIHAIREDLADARLRHRVRASRYVEGMPARVGASIADVLKEPGSSGAMVRQLIYGELVTIFDTSDGYSWIQRACDGYVGYVRADCLGDPGPPPTHVVSQPRTFVYPGADLRFPRTGELSMGSLLRVTGETETRGTIYSMLNDGNAVIAKHLRPVSDHAADFVSVAAQLLHTPYLWGGNSGFGIDCSGLVQLAMMMTGKSVAADSDQQAATIGAPTDTANKKYDNLRRGDLVFWQGHAGIMEDGDTLLHASGHTMSVSREPLNEAVARIAYLYDYPTIVRRP